MSASAGWRCCGGGAREWKWQCECYGEVAEDGDRLVDAFESVVRVVQDMRERGRSNSISQAQKYEGSAGGSAES